MEKSLSEKFFLHHLGADCMGHFIPSGLDAFLVVFFFLATDRFK